jgi:myo-inositol 2-dehydrogenase / D-chiro-inositol 1-dehydrogenase
VGRVRLAVLGCGEVARDHHLPWLARIPDASVAVVADQDPAALAAAARLAPGALAVGDWREAVAAPGVDAVLVCLPNQLHAAAAEAAAAQKRHVYVEKPLATTLPDAERVVAACEAAGVIGMMGFNYRFNMLYAEARELLADGRLGSAALCRTEFMLARSDVPSWKRLSSTGGGVLLDLAPHHIDLVAWLLQDGIVDVLATVSTRASEGDTAALTLRLRGGAVAQLAFAYGLVDAERFEIDGDRGRLIVDRRRHQRAFIEVPGDGRLRRAARSARDTTRFRYILEKRAAPGGEPSHGAALRRFVASVRAGERAEPGLTAGRDCAAVLDAAERSVRSERWEHVADRPVAVAPERVAAS